MGRKMLEKTQLTKDKKISATEEEGMILEILGWDREGNGACSSSRKNTKCKALSTLRKPLLCSFSLLSLGTSKNTKATGLASPVSVQLKPLFTSIESSAWFSCFVFMRPYFHAQVTMSLIGSKYFQNVPAHNSPGAPATTFNADLCWNIYRQTSTDLYWTKDFWGWNGGCPKKEHSSFLNYPWI